MGTLLGVLQGLSSNCLQPCVSPLKSFIFRCLYSPWLASLGSCARGLQILQGPHVVPKKKEYVITKRRGSNTGQTNKHSSLSPKKPAQDCTALAHGFKACSCS